MKLTSKSKSLLKKSTSILSSLIFLMALTFPSYSQQTRTVTGTVKDAGGVPLAGVTVMVEGTFTGTVTGPDGRFSIQTVPGHDKLKFTFVGMQPQTVDAAGKNIIEVVMAEDTYLMNDIVVVGYGTVRRSDLSGSVSSVKGDELTTPAVSSVGSMLRGKAPGLNITQNSAKPGGNLSISIRGQSTPLIIIDGVPQATFAQLNPGSIYGGGTNDAQLISINPEDIESIDILKDAASTAIYGANAAGGVILITTKKGKASQAGTQEIIYTGGYSLQRLSDYPEFLDAKSFMIEQNKVFYELNPAVGPYSRHSQEKIENFMGSGTKWIDEVTRTGVVNEHNLSVRSGNEKTQYLVSGSYFDNKGVAKNNQFTRMTGRINLDHQFGKMIKGGVNVGYTYLKYNNVPLGDARHEKSALIYSAMTFNPLVPVFDENGKYTDNPDRAIYANPVSLLEITDITNNNNLNANLYIELTPFKGFSIKGLVGVDNKGTNANQYIPRTTKAGAEKNGIASKNEGESQMLLTNIVANYNTRFMSLHSLNVMVGWEYRKNSWNGTYVTASNFPTDAPLWNSLQASEQDSPYLYSYRGSDELASYFSRINFSFADRYLLTANMRVDGSSNFSEKNQYGFFPGVSVAWRIDQEPFMGQNNRITNLKLRAGWGEVGNAGSLSGINTFYTIRPNAYAFGGSMANGAKLAQIGNPNLKWQTSTDINLGLDFGFFKNRITGAVDVYQRIERDIILRKSLMSYNEITTIDYNSAEKWRTRGIDFTLNTINIETPDFSWNTDLTISYYEIYTIARDEDFNPDVYQSEVEKWGNVWLYRSVGLIAADETVAWMPAGQAGNIKYADLNGYVVDGDGNRVRDENGLYQYTGTPDGILNNADLYLAGNTTPIPFGFNNAFRYKKWDLSAYIYGSLNGFKRNELLELCSSGITDMTYGLNALSAVKNRWSPDNPAGTLPSVSNATSGVYTGSGDFYFEDAWYARLDNLSLGYTFSGPRLSKFCNSIKISAGIRNLLVLTPYGGMDPETGNGIGAYPNQRTYVFGLNIKL